MVKETVYSSKQSKKEHERMHRGSHHGHELRNPLLMAVGLMLPTTIAVLILSQVFTKLFDLLLLPIAAFYFLVCSYIYGKKFPGEIVETGVVVQLKTHKNPALRDEKKILKLVPFPVNLINYMLFKPNQNGLIIGVPGTGKTLLATKLLLQKFKIIENNQTIFDFDDYQKVVISFKDKDAYTSNLPFYRVDTSKELPNPFDMDIEGFVTSFLITFPLTKVTIQPSLIPPALRDLANRSKNWVEFSNNLKKDIITEKDHNKKGALVWIQEQSKALSSIMNTANFKIPNNIDVIFDFGALKNKEQAKTFYAELILRQLWDEKQNDRRGPMVITIDEAHRLTIAQFQDFKTILNEMLREARSKDVWMWALTQNYSDLDDEHRNMFATQFVFNSSGERDLQALRPINQNLTWIVSKMPNYTFTDARFSNQDVFIPLYTITLEQEPQHPPTPPDTPEEQRTAPAATPPKPEPKPTELVEQKRGSSEQEQSAPEADYLLEIDAILKSGPNYQTEIARQILRKYHLQVTEASLDQTKLKVKKVLEDLFNSGEYGRMLVERSRKKGTVILYYGRNDNESGLHKYLQKETVKILEYNRSLKVLHLAVSGEMSNSDITVGFQNGTPVLEVECETGLQHRTDTLKQRVDRFVTTTNENVVIIVPNSQTLDRYKKFVAEYSTGRVLLYTLESYEKSMQQDVDREKGGEVRRP